MTIYCLLLLLALQDDCIEATGPDLTAGVIAAKRGAFRGLPADLSFGPAPNIGVRRDISSATLKSWLRSEQIGAEVEPICVYRIVQARSDQSWISDIVSSLIIEFGIQVEPGQIQLRAKRIAPGQVGKTILARANLHFNASHSQYSWRGHIQADAAKAKTPVSLEFEMTYTQRCLATIRRMQMGDLLVASDLQEVGRPWIPMKAACVSDRSALINKVLRRSVDREIVIEPFLIADAPAIRPGDEVLVASHSGNARVSLSAISRGKGCIGEPLLVELPRTRRLLRAVVTGSGQAEITAAPARRRP